MNENCFFEKGGKILSRKGNYCVKRKQENDPDDIMAAPGQIPTRGKRPQKSKKSIPYSDRKLRKRL
jgi:hypothetical protein